MDEEAEGAAGLLLDEQLCFALYAASRAVTAAYRPLLDSLGLTYPQYLVMLVLWEKGAVSVGQIGEQLHLDSGTLSPLLKRLEAAGLVSRRRGTVDERSVVITATEDGAALRTRACAVPPQMAEAVGLPADALQQLQRTLLELAARVSGRGRPSAADAA